jgi:hypothetical protein
LNRVREAIEEVKTGAAIEVRGAVCPPDPEGLPLLSHLTVRGSVLDDPKLNAR